MSPATAKRDSASTSRSPRRGWGMLAVGLLVGGVIGLCVGHLPRLVEDVLRGSAAPTTMLSTGRVEGPAGIDLASLRVVASRNGRGAGQGEVDADGRFRVTVVHGGPFDLFCTDWKAWRDPHAPNREPTPEVAVEGGVMQLAWGARGVCLRVEPRTLESTSILVRGPDGSPAVDATVWLRSMTQEVRESTGADGVARFEDLPVRSWRAVSALHGGGETALVTGWRDFVPTGQTVEVSIPEGVRVFVRFAGPVPDDVELRCEVPSLIHVYQTIPWRPGPGGRMALLVPPDCHSLALDAKEFLERTERQTVERTFAAGAAAVVPDAEIVLLPLER